MNTNEIVKALRCMHAFEGAPSDMTCGDCEYYESFSGTIVDSEDDGCPGLCNGKFCVQAADLIERLQKELNAAKADIKQCFKVGECEDGEPIYDIGICQFCKKSKSDDLCDCGSGVGQGGFEWRGRESEVK